MANMRSITVALHGYLQDHANIWPQGPSPEAGSAWDQFWIGSLQPYGISQSTWRCPAISARTKAGGSEEAAIHYAPTMFEAIPGQATRWNRHPWLIERASVHRHGPLICFPDGGVKSMDKVLAEQGVR